MGEVIRLRFGKKDVKQPKLPKEAEWLKCPKCRSDQEMFDVIVQRTAKGKIQVKSLICMSDICAGETILNVENGIVEPR